MAVVNHEKALKEQAKKMGVDSLRSGDKVGWTLNLIWIKNRLQFFLFLWKRLKRVPRWKFARWQWQMSSCGLLFGHLMQVYATYISFLVWVWYLFYSFLPRNCHVGCVWRQKQDHPTDGTVPLNGSKGCNMFQPDRVCFVSSQVRILTIY